MGGKGSGGRRGSGPSRDSNPSYAQADPSNVDVSVNSRVMSFGKALMALDAPDYADPESVRERVMLYLDLCDEHGIRPMVMGLASALCMTRQALWGVVNGDPKYRGWRGVTRSSTDVLQKAYGFLQVSWENFLVEEKGNPVKWLFLGKNYFGYEDQTVRIQRQEDDSKSLPSAEEVAAKYAMRMGRESPALEATIEEVEDVG